LIEETSVPNLFVLPSGIVPDNPSELLGSSRMDGLIENISSRYNDHIVVFDSPPLQAATEAVTLSARVDAIVLVVRQGLAKKGEVKKSIDAVDARKIVGIVFNDIVSLS
jgi:Mrp family chromosome partitioning ATPase